MFCFFFFNQMPPEMESHTLAGPGCEINARQVPNAFLKFVLNTLLYLYM